MVDAPTIDAQLTTSMRVFSFELGPKRKDFNPASVDNAEGVLLPSIFPGRVQSTESTVYAQLVVLVVLISPLSVPDAPVLAGPRGNPPFAPTIPVVLSSTCVLLHNPTHNTHYLWTMDE